MFVFSKDNRELTVRKDLIEKMKQLGFPSCHAILCRRLKNGQLEILRGQHRFAAAQDLGIKLWYEVTDDQFDVLADANGTKAWKVMDHVNVHARRETGDYVEFKRFCESNGIGPTAAASLFSGHRRGGSDGRELKDGTFRIKDRNLANAVVKMLSQITQICPKIGQSRLIDALLGVALIDGFNLAMWLKKIKLNASRLKKCETQDGYRAMLEDVFNYRSAEKINIAFLAKESLKNAS